MLGLGVPVIVAPALEMSAQQREQLGVMACSHTVEYRVVRQARALLWAGDGLANAEIARRSGATTKTVRRWRSRFEADGVASVGRVRPGRGRPRVIGDAVVAAVVADTLGAEPPGGATHWTTRSMAERHGVGKDTVAGIWQGRGLRPWRVETFKLSADPRFEAKLVDVVGLYLDPPQNAVVLCVDEKSQCQALERTQPSLPLKRGRAATMTHDYRRHGTTTLFAALNAATGEVLADCRPRHRHQEFLGFLRLIERNVPAELDVHLVIDNYAAHKHDNVTKWLQAPHRKDRWHVHYTPTSASWLNLVERWFKELTDKRLRRGSFTSVNELIDAINTWTNHWNQDPKPFIWHRTAQEIITKVQRGRANLTRITKSATDH